MKVLTSRSDPKKRKRDEAEEPISESPKRTKVHAQRKFAQGAAFSSPAITPIKDKTRPAASVSSSGPMLTNKRPNTEDFLTFLCFRRTSILPPQLDFFKEALKPEQQPSAAIKLSSNSISQKPTVSDQSAKQNAKKNDEKKTQTPAVQALRQKYQEQRLAKQKPTNVTKLAQKVKGKNMIRTRSSTLNEEIKPVTKKPIVLKENKSRMPSLRSGLQRVVQPPANKKLKKPVKPKNLRTGLRSSTSNTKPSEKEIPEIKPSTVKKVESIKKPKVDNIEIKTKVVKGVLKKVEGLSDFSSDDNEPLLAVKKPKPAGRKPLKKPVVEIKEEKKTFVKTRSQIVEEPTQPVSIRPTRKTKEAAAIYMEMITKKLVSPEKSGDDDLSSVDSFPELPNARRNEQRESEIRAKALATKKAAAVDGGKQKIVVDDKEKEKRATVKKNEPVKKVEAKPEAPKKAATKKENVKQEEKSANSKKINLPAPKETALKGKKREAVENNEISRPSTRSRSQEDVTSKVKRIPEKNLVKKSKFLLRKGIQKRDNMGSAIQTIPAKRAKVTRDSKPTETTSNKDDVKATSSALAKEKASNKMAKKENKQKGDLKDAEKKSKSVESGAKANKKEDSEASTKKQTVKKPDKKAVELPEVDVEPTTSNKRPTRKCSTVDKIWIDMDAFTSDEEDFIDVKSIASTRSNSSKKGEDNFAPSKKKAKAPSKSDTVKEPDKCEKKADNKLAEAPIVKMKSTIKIDKSESIIKSDDKLAVKYETDLAFHEFNVKKLDSNISETKTEFLPVKLEEKKTDVQPKDQMQLGIKNNREELKLIKEVSVPVKPAKVVKETPGVGTEPKTKAKTSKEEKDEKKEAGKNRKEVKSSETAKPNKEEARTNKQIVQNNAAAEVNKKEAKVGKEMVPVNKQEPVVINKEGIKIDREAASVSKETKSVKAAEAVVLPSSSKDKTVNENVSGSKIVAATNKEPETISKPLVTNKKEEVKISNKVVSNSNESKVSKEIVSKNKEESKSTKGVVNANSDTKNPDKEVVKANSDTKNPDKEVKISKDTKDKTGKNEKSEEKGNKGATEQKQSQHGANEEQKKLKDQNRPSKGKSTGSSEKPSRSLRERTSVHKRDFEFETPVERVTQRTRPIRQCSTGEKMWIDSDSDSFSYYDSSDDEDDLPIVDFKNKNKSSEEPKAKPKPDVKDSCDNFSESDEEPLQKKTVPPEKPIEKKSASTEVKPATTKSLREVPNLTPIKKPTSDAATGRCSDGATQVENLVTPPKIDSEMTKNFASKSEISEVRITYEKGEISDLSNRKVAEEKVAIVTIPEPQQIRPMPTLPSPFVCTFSPMLTRPCEPINTHGLDLLSEVALPTSKDKKHLQTERIEKWLKDSLSVENKKAFPMYDEVECAEKKTYQPEDTHAYLKSYAGLASKLRPEIRQDGCRVEVASPSTPKKTVTSVQDLLKLQKERKDSLKPSVDNSPHLKNCKCNSCIVKKGWFKNKPIPKNEEQPKTLTPVEEEEAEKPFHSLSKALNKITSTKMSVSVAPLVHSEKKPIFQQRKLSFLERMKERERKEAALSKPNANAFSPNNESSVYAFEPEPEQPATFSTPFRSRTRDSRTSSTTTSKSEEDILKICEDEGSQSVSSGTQVDKKLSSSAKASQSASIAVQVNLDSEPAAPAETTQELQDGKSIEISTQTEVPEEDSDSPMFYIPLQQSGNVGSAASDQQMIQGVALKLGTEGPMGPNQRVIMKAKLVTKPPDTRVVMPQPKRIFDQKNNNPPVGTVQPTTRKPPEVPSDESKSADLEFPQVPKQSSQASTDSGVGSESSTPKLNRASPSCSKAGKTREKSIQSGSKLDSADESSPSSSKSKRASKPKSAETVINPTNTTWLPPAGTSSKLVEAPTFHPTEKEFQDPLEFFDRIRPAAEKFGLCRIVPPSNFKPDCKVTDDMRFTAYNQYVHRMLHRWGPSTKEMMAIKKYLATQSISLKQPPWIGGIEVDLPRLYQSVQNCGGLMKVMEKKKWQQVADMMKIPKAAQDRVTKLDDIYCKYLLPYDTLSHDERQKLFDEVEKDWVDRQRSSEASEGQGDEESEEENYIDECEECIAKGRNMALNQFYRIARNTMSMWFKSPEPPPGEVETEFWRHVSERNHHVCVHSGSIDSSGWGYGFPIAKNNSFSKHPWNLKVLTNNSGSVLRSLGSVMGVTVPTLHVGMVFTAFCWYRDPHGLPWIEYLHTGAPKIWYGISDDNSSVFQEALTKLLPRYIKNKTIWMPSDTAMVPPALLVEHGVSLCHTIQEPGQFILVFPRAFTSSICTGYLVSESVYFAQPSWLTTAEQVFKDIQESCEPTMFSLEKLLFNIATDSRSSVEVLKQVLPMVWHIRQNEIDGRKTLFNLGLKSSARLPLPEFGSKKKKGRWAQDDDGDYECEICRTNLYVSLVTNSHEEGVYCLPHAIELLTQKRHHLKYCKLMYSFSQEEMNELVEKLEQRIEAKSQKKLQNKSTNVK